MNFSFSDDVPGSASHWLSFGRTQRNHGLGATSPGVATSPHASGAVAASPNEGNPDDVSFAESYRPENSPLFNPLFLPATNSPDVAPPPGLTSNAGAWESNNRQSSPLARVAPAQSPDLSTEPKRAAPLEDASVQSPVADTSRKLSPHQESNASAFLGETDAQKLVADPPRELSPLQESAARLAGGGDDQSRSVDGFKQDAMNTRDSIQAVVEDVHEERSEKVVVEITERKSEELIDDGFKEFIDEAIGVQDDVQDPEEPAPISATKNASLIANNVNADETVQPDQMDVDSEGSSPSRRRSVDDSAIPPPSTKRSRRNASQMLNAAAETFVKHIDGPRKRFSTAPASPAVRSTPVSAAKRARKSMPARINAETPKKRGRPRKSDGVATPATTQGTGKRGRPRKSDAVPAMKDSPKTTRAPPTPRAITNIQKSAAPSPGKAAQSSPAATPNKVGRPRKTPAVDTPSAEAADTPKRRGRPPKNTPQPSSAKSAVPTASGRGLRSAEAELPEKRTRTVKPRVVPSPAKRGRPARKAAASASKSAPVKPAPAKRAATRGRPAATKAVSDESEVAAAAIEPPKRRGRPPKNPAASAAKESAEEPAKEPATKRRRRGATAPEEPPVVETKKRGRAAQSTAEDVAAPVAKKTRGRPKRSEPKVDAPEPPAKRQRTTRAAEKPAAPTRRAGRSAADEVPEKTTVASRAKSTRSQPETASATVEVSKTTRGRGAAKSTAVKPAPAPAPKPRGRPPKSGKGELPSSKAATEEQAPKRTRGRGAGPTGVVKKSAEPVGARRALRSRG
ncbi:hypothetical protein AK830_g9378 [Neonectria ditissima]|uniref:Uncharacterized protein n=1 Tax=Neonectria ditissima TaxID=78410 RepID=A0A0P7AS02_9HYPO|nr:hypothetical protein AK830_g9378 [Neonectria ditissima]